MVGTTLASCTKDIRKSKVFRVGRRKVQLVDTPGFSDDDMPDWEVFLSIANWIVSL